MNLCDDIKHAIQSFIPNSYVEVSSLDGVHFSATISANAFGGLSRIKQHQMVYNALEKYFGVNWSDQIHALEIKTITGE